MNKRKTSSVSQGLYQQGNSETLVRNRCFSSMLGFLLVLVCVVVSSGKGSGGAGSCASGVPALLASSRADYRRKCIHTHTRYCASINSTYTCDIGLFFWRSVVQRSGSALRPWSRCRSYSHGAAVSGTGKKHAGEGFVRPGEMARGMHCSLLYDMICCDVI
jgi:hypothetical protein